MKTIGIVTLFGACSYSVAGVVTYESDVLPVDANWQRDGTLDADVWVEDGRFCQFADLGVWAPGPRGENDIYRASFAPFAGEPSFFMEWRVQTSIPPWVLEQYSGVPTVFSAGGTGNVNYHFTITDGLVRVIRSNLLPIFYVRVQPGNAHRYRVELHADRSYAWYIDGFLIDDGIPVGTYPRNGSSVVWGAGHDYVDNLACWDYVRYGTIPVDASGDYDSDDAVDLFDYYFARECFADPDYGSGPSCRFVDFNSDGMTDLLDFAEFQNLVGQLP